ncbi:MAG: hypothetical protein KDA32_03825 [Phycisphaerales bacterium]|nr:hypothetical protein [Phycisphaerales bacterium]
MGRRRHVFTTAALGAAFLLTTPSGLLAQNEPHDGVSEVPIQVSKVRRQDARVGGGERNPIADRGTCSQIATLTDAAFSGAGSCTAQAGFSQGETIAATYTIPAGQFPIIIEGADVMFGTMNATETTTTELSFFAWQGNPGSGLVETFSSTSGDIVPLTIGPGTNCVVYALQVDPNDPFQIVVNNDGSNSFSVGFRVDRHNFPPTPCFNPNTSRNAFPTTDTSGVFSGSKNWLNPIDCGFAGCPAGWQTFDQLPGNPGSGCTPSGDWILRVHWRPVSCTPGIGACCLPDGSCEPSTPTDCGSNGGTYQGDGVLCQSVQCEPQDGACCFEMGCINLSAADCNVAGGTPGPAGSTCATFVCNPMGACCLPDGSCIGPVSPQDCETASGAFRGNGTSCGDVVCPQPEGACCFSNGNCLVLTEGDCSVAGTWLGAGTTCGDCSEDPCPQDIDNDGSIGLSDLAALLAAYATCPQDAGYNPDANIAGDDCINLADLAGLLAAYGTPCP